MCATNYSTHKKIQSYINCNKNIRIQGNWFLKIRCRQYLLAFIFICFASITKATDYHVSNAGDDSKDGTTPGKAWRTINKVNKTKFAPGDQILFEKGGIWRERLIVPSSGVLGNPIVFGAYVGANGNENNPIIDGADIISAMTSAGSNVWQKTGITIEPNLMYLNDTIGTKQTSPEACTSEGDWYWNSGTDILYVYTEGGDPSGNIELGQRKKIVDLGSHEYITLKNLTIQHSNEINIIGSQDFTGAINLLNGSNLIISNCIVQQNNMYGVQTINSPHITLDYSTFSSNGLGGINFSKCDYSTVTNCISQDNTSYGVFAFLSSYLTLDSNTFLRNNKNASIYSNASGMSNITFTNNQCNYALADGLTIASDDKVNSITQIDIHGNHFDYNGAAAIYIVKLDSIAVHHNYFTGNGDPVHPGEDYSIGISSCDNLDIYQNTITNQLYNDAIQLAAAAAIGNAVNVRIFQNHISGVTNGDCIGISSTEGYLTENVQIFYNFLASADAYGVNVYHPTTQAASVDIFNNTFYENVSGGVRLQSDSIPAVVKNNIFYNNGSPDVNVVYTINDQLTTSNNLWYRTSGNVLLYRGNTYTTATITNFEATAQNTDPLFTDPDNGDFTLQEGSPAINNGVLIPTIPQFDILGNPIVGTPDIGAVGEKKMTIKSNIPPKTFQSVKEVPIRAGQAQVSTNGL